MAQYRVVVEDTARDGELAIQTKRVELTGDDLAWMLAEAIDAIAMRKSEVVAKVVRNTFEGEGLVQDFVGYEESVGEMLDGANDMLNGWKDNDEDIEARVFRKSGD